MKTPERLYLTFLLVAFVTACAAPGAADCRICSDFEDSSVWIANGRKVL